MTPRGRHTDHSIVYVCALIADQPRAIDRYIDYFGETSLEVEAGSAEFAQ
jgi:hypothetical protein